MMWVNKTLSHGGPICTRPVSSLISQKTQKKIIQVAQLPVNMINIWPNTKNPLYIKKNKMINKILNKN
mgnify:CR=1 FL=1